MDAAGQPLQLATTGRDQQVLRLNTPSVWSGVAILPDEGATSRKQSRVLAEDWLSRLNPEGGTVAVVQTLKHMSASFNISKSTKTVPLTELRNDKFWARLFSEEAANQTIFVGLARPDARHAHAGERSRRRCGPSEASSAPPHSPAPFGCSNTKRFGEDSARARRRRRRFSSAGSKLSSLNKPGSAAPRGYPNSTPTRTSRRPFMRARSRGIGIEMIDRRDDRGCATPLANCGWINH